MIAGGPSGGDSHQARKSQVREAHQISIKEVLDVETMEDAPLIQFGRAERSGPQTMHNDALVITAILANYEVRRIFIDSGSSADILFGEAYDQNAIRGCFLRESKYLAIWVCRRSRASSRHGLPPSGRWERDRSQDLPTLNTFQAVISTYHMNIKFPTPGGIGEYKATLFNSEGATWTLSVEERRGAEMTLKTRPLLIRKGKAPEEKISEAIETPAKVQPAEELLNIQIIPGDPDKTTRIGSHLVKEAKKEITLCLQRNADIFAPQDLEGLTIRLLPIIST
ncbi:UNVERIFIED_CONTAM: hypothetical protein Slati_0142900 [Sesamum latifolium]|uniref:Uncharacterized protein n=1 Tax=Sesamum latifolium TaxID=2727402 RepID=A0AAW2Y9N9_9LAMI